MKKIKNQKAIITRHKISVSNKNKEAGITLIALVVTIIVLIILAGVSMNLVLGDNGIVSKAKQARENFQKATEEEATKLNELGNLSDIINDNDFNKEYYVEEEEGVYILLKTGMSFTDGVEAATTFSDAYVVTNNKRTNVKEGMKTKEYNGYTFSLLSFEALEENPLYNYYGDYDIIIVKDGVEYSYKVNGLEYYLQGNRDGTGEPSSRFQIVSELGERISIQPEFEPKMTVEGENLNSIDLSNYIKGNRIKEIDLSGGAFSQYNGKTATITLNISGKELTWTGIIISEIRD